MSDLTPQMDAALTQERALVFGAVEINLPGYDLRLLDGSAEIPMFGSIFRGRDEMFGTIGAIDPLRDGAGDEAPRVNLTLLPPDGTAAATLAAASMQGSRVRIWLGVLNAATGLPVPDPTLLFDGELDIATLKWTMRGREVEYRIVSVFERFFDNEEGIRLSDSHHQSVWPGELGLGFVTGVAEQVPWGVEGSGSVVAGGGGGGGIPPWKLGELLDRKF